MAVLHLVPFYCGTTSELLDPLALKLREVFHMRVEQHPPYFDPEQAFDASRGQYNSRTLLVQLLDHDKSAATRVLGVTGVDLFIPVLTYVFGEAQLDGRVAVISSYRLDNRLYGLPEDRELFFDRLCKEAIHELGHTYNLVHCPRQRCVMVSSTYVEDIDIKDDRFCTPCRKKVEAAVNPSAGIH